MVEGRRKMQERRDVVEIPLLKHHNTAGRLDSLSQSYYQSFLLLSDAARNEAAASPGTFSRFVPSAIVLLHAFVDAQINAELRLSYYCWNTETQAANEGRILNLINLSLTRERKKARQYAGLYPQKRTFAEATLLAMDHLCDFRDVLFHNQPEFRGLNQTLKGAYEVIKAAGVAQTVQPWTDHASDIKVLDWAHGVVKAYFEEMSSVTGARNPLSWWGNDKASVTTAGGDTVDIRTMEESWDAQKFKIVPRFYGR